MSLTKRSTARKKHPVPKPAARDQYFSRAVSKALEILEVLQRRPEALTLHEIARQVQLSKTSAFRLLRTLETVGYLAANGGGRFTLATGMQSFAAGQWLSRLQQAAMPVLEELGGEFRETASLAALFENRIEVVGVVESPQAIRMSNIVGHIVPPNASSLGKSIIAFQSTERMERILRSYGLHRFTEHTIVGHGELLREFERVRQQRFATDREESVVDGTCFGVPVLGETDGVVAAISISLPKGRLRDARHESVIVNALAAASARITAALEDTAARR